MPKTPPRRRARGSANGPTTKDRIGDKVDEARADAEVKKAEGDVKKAEADRDATEAKNDYKESLRD
jgi:hypothetical protein